MKQYRSNGSRKFSLSNIPGLEAGNMALFVLERFRHYPAEAMKQYASKKWEVLLVDSSRFTDELLTLSGDGYFVFRNEGLIDPGDIYGMK